MKKLFVLLALVLGMFMLPSFVLATTYTYTGMPFTLEMQGSVWPSTPAIGNHLTASFTYDGDLSAVLGQQLIGKAALTDYSFSCGDVVIGPPLGGGYASLQIYAVDGGGVPTQWIFQAGSSYYTGPYYAVYSQWNTTDSASYKDPTYQWPAKLLAHRYNGPPGTWSAVPLPPSVLLLGSGLLGLGAVGWRRRKASDLKEIAGLPGKSNSGFSC